ncbi:MAG: hypothetical protein EAZ97_01935 [Bacteroidetes bacterium]|nr:MAG: hypothetical protein EAZ97_01935 [Bacteroidota bacterium]
MVYFEKTDNENAKKALKEAKIIGGECKSPEVLNALCEEFYNKCYLCEQKNPTSIHVEHFEAHNAKNNPKFYYSWKNLFWSCGHCNQAKDNIPILNCTNKKHDVSNWIKYKIDDSEKVILESVYEGTSEKYKKFINNTIKLLLKIYNGVGYKEGTYLGPIESENLRKKLIEEVDNFKTCLKKYEECLAEEKPQILKKIKRHLSKQSAFTAFKRWIILDNEYLKKEFEKYFD